MIKVLFKYKKNGIFSKTALKLAKLKLSGSHLNGTLASSMVVLKAPKNIKAIGAIKATEMRISIAYITIFLTITPGEYSMLSYFLVLTEIPVFFSIFTLLTSAAGRLFTACRLSSAQLFNLRVC